MSDVGDRNGPGNRGCGEIEEWISADENSADGIDRIRRGLDHERECPDCAGLADAVRMLAETPRLSDDEAMSLARRAVGIRARQRRVRGLAAGAIGVAASVAALTIAILARQEPSRDATRPRPLALALETGTVVADGEALFAGDAARNGQMVEARSGTARLRANHALAVAMTQGSRLSIESLGENDARFRLTYGRIAVGVEPGRWKRLAVITPLGRVEVKGTIFFVAVEDNDVRVSVVRGEVQVWRALPRTDRVETVRGGWTLELVDGRRATLARAEEHETLAMLGLAGTDIAPAGRVSPPSGTGEVPETSDETGDTAPTAVITPQTAGTAAQHPAGRNGHGKAVPDKPRLDDLIRAARVCRADRDWPCAVNGYKRVIDLYPDRPEALTVLVPWAQIELDHMAMPEAALARFRAYTERAHSGPLAQEALYGECRALERLGRHQEAIRAARRFLELYPASVYAQQVEAMLRALEKGGR